MAVALPLLVVASAFYTLGSKPTKDQERQLRNAGMLLNGEVLERPATEVIAEHVAREPRLVILGNSFANTNVQLDLLLTELGFEKGQGARLSIPNTIGAHWYAMLKNHVFIEGRRPPELVLIASDLQSALLTTPLSQGSMGNLDALAPRFDDVLDQRVERWGNWWWNTVQEGRRRWRFTSVSKVKESAARVVHPMVPAKRLRRLTNDAMDQVFHPALTQPRLAKQALPVASLQVDLGELPTPHASFLEPIARLCYEHGARLVLVRNRESPLIAVGMGDIVPEGTETEVRSLIAPYGGVLIDSRRLPMVAEHFDNIDHMTREGSRRFTLVLGAAMRDLGMPSDTLFVPPAPQRNGDLGSELAAVRQSWTRLDAPVRWQFPPTGAHPLRIRAHLEGGTLVADGEPLPLVEHRIDVSRVADDDGLTLEARGPGLLTGLAVGEGAPRLLVGHHTDLDPDHLDLLAVPEVFDGDVYLEGMSPRFDAPPPRLKGAPQRPAAGPRGTGVFDVARLHEISDLATRQHTLRYARCSPVRVRENGQLLDIPNVGCDEVTQLRSGRSCHGENRLFFSASDTSNPLRNGRRYRLALDPERACDGGFWLYPGDAATIDVEPNRLLELREGFSRVEAELAFPQDRPDGVTMSLFVDEQPWGSTRVERQGPWVLEVDRVPPTARVSVRFEHPTRGFVLVNRVTLRR